MASRQGVAMSSLQSVLGRVVAAAIAVAALGSTVVCADPLGLAGPMRNPGMIFDNVVRDQGSDLGMPAHLRRQVVQFSGSEAPGTIINDTENTYLYYVLGSGRAIRYGIGVGREGFTWSGVETIARKAEWPDWIPPAEMIARSPYLPRWVAGGPGNRPATPHRSRPRRRSRCPPGSPSQLRAPSCAPPASIEPGRGRLRDADRVDT